MRMLQVENNEAFRIDRFIVRVYGQYGQFYQDVLRHFNPDVSFIDLKGGTFLRVPNLQEIREADIRGKYKLVNADE